MKPACSLIIATYNWPDALELVLNSLLKQKHMPDEVIIADDGSKQATTNLIKEYQKRIPVPVKHIWHEDTGFTKSLILNKAIKAASNEYIIQIDGDIIMHPRFVEDHLNFSEKGCWINGSRVLLSKEKSESILKNKKHSLTFLSNGLTNRFNALHIPLFRDLFFSSKKLNIDKARGCNMSYWKYDFISVNGYNEEITGWGREDSELVARMVNNNIYKKTLKFGGIEFHIYHPEASRNRLSFNDEIQDIVIAKKIKYCENGYHKAHS